jgi:hypothetical protein
VIYAPLSLSCSGRHTRISPTPGSIDAIACDDISLLFKPLAIAGETTMTFFPSIMCRQEMLAFRKRLHGSAFESSLLIYASIDS